MSKENISKIKLLTRGKTITKCGITTGKDLLQYHSVLTKMNKILKPTGGCVDISKHIRSFFY